MKRVERVPARSGRAWRLPHGSVVKVVDVVGSQTGDVFAVPVDDLEDGLSNGRTFNYRDHRERRSGKPPTGRDHPTLTVWSGSVRRSV